MELGGPQVCMNTLVYTCLHKDVSAHLGPLASVGRAGNTDMIDGLENKEA